jgi:hypothetical protein
VPGQHELHPPAGAVIVQVQGMAPLYVQVQVEPEQLACHVLPVLSWHEVVHVCGPFGPAPPLPEHAPAPPAPGRGMLGHTLLGTPLPLPLPPLDVWPEDEPPLMQSVSACCCESHPAYCAMPPSGHVGSTGSMHRRKSVAAGMHDGAIEAKAGQLIGQSLPVPEEQAARVILSHVTVHDAVIWAVVHVFPHVASGPAAPPPASVAPVCA